MTVNIVLCAYLWFKALVNMYLVNIIIHSVWIKGGSVEHRH